MIGRYYLTFLDCRYIQEYLEGVTDQQDAQDDLVCGYVHMNVQTVCNVNTVLLIWLYEHL